MAHRTTVFAICLLGALCCPALGASTVFAYQGRLEVAGSPATGQYDMRISLYETLTGGSPVVSTVSLDDVEVEAGLFTVEVDFGQTPFAGAVRYLQLEVRPGSSTGSYTLISPRTKITASPYAITAASIILPYSGTVAAADDTTLSVVNSAETGSSWGVSGQADSPNGRGVFGWAPSAAGLNYGGFFRSDGDEGRGVLGWATSETGGTYGVWGSSDSEQGAGVLGWASSPTGGTDGVSGQSDSPYGVGVNGYASSQTGSNSGVFGQSDSTEGVGVFGRAAALSGSTYGLYGESTSISGAGAAGYATSFTGRADGVFGRSDSSTGIGVNAWASSPSGNAIGVYGQSDSNTGTGVYGRAASGSGVTFGVYGQSDSPDGYGVYSDGSFAATGYKSFQIDHPLDPANKYLNHFSAEGPEAYLIYRGNIILDATGSALVKLPLYFESVNTDFTYQLTPVGTPMPELHVAAEVSGNAFKIAGGQAGGKVSWMVTGIRSDPWMREHGRPAEQEKPAELKGSYVHPDAYAATSTRANRHAERTKPALNRRSRNLEAPR